jgi:GntR family transcriptional regulator, transcriptional repressor for pyruvate dehydrogenase complex
LTKVKSKAHSAVDRVAGQLRGLALAAEPGDYIGSEVGLSRLCGVTGPTLRQAIRLLEHEELIRVKRGLKGGYFAHRPDLDTVSRVAAVYVRGNLKSLDEVSVLVEYVQPLLIDLVLASKRLSELEPFADRGSAATSYEDFVDKQSRFVVLLWDVSENVPMRLIYSIFFQVGQGLHLDPPGEMTPAVRELDRLRLRLAQALVAGDRQTAIDLSISQCRVIHAGLKENLARIERERRLKTRAA